MSATAITLHVGQIPGELRSFGVEPGTPISSVLEMADLSADGFEIRLDGVRVSESDEIKATSSRLYLIKQLKSA